MIKNERNLTLTFQNTNFNVRKESLQVRHIQLINVFSISWIIPLRVLSEKLSSLYDFLINDGRPCEREKTC